MLSDLAQPFLLNKLNISNLNLKIVRKYAIKSFKHYR